MSSATHNILLIDGNPRHAKELREAFVATGGNPSNFDWVKTLSKGLDRVIDAGKKDIWAIFLNLFLPDSCSLETFEKLSTVKSTVPIVVLGGVNSEAPL